MIEDEFNNKFTQLQEAFDHKIKSQSAKQYWYRVKSYGVYIWHDAVEFIISHDDRFPRIARMLEVLEELRFKKKQNDALSKKPGMWESPTSILLAIAFPPDLKASLEKRMNGELTQEQLEIICKAHEPEKKCPRLCIDGYVRYWKVMDQQRYSYTAKCDCVLAGLIIDPIPLIAEIIPCGV